MANKLHYEAYTKGEKNLTGKVEIAEGLTAQSASMRMEDITYRDADGRGQYLYTPAVDIPEEQDVTEFSTAITGDETADTFYVNHGVLKMDYTALPNRSRRLLRMGRLFPAARGWEVLWRPYPAAVKKSRQRWI